MKESLPVIKDVDPAPGVIHTLPFPGNQKSGFIHYALVKMVSLVLRTVLRIHYSRTYRGSRVTYLRHKFWKQTQTLLGLSQCHSWISCQPWSVKKGEA